MSLGPKTVTCSQVFPHCSWLSSLPPFYVIAPPASMPLSARWLFLSDLPSLCFQALIKQDNLDAFNERTPQGRRLGRRRRRNPRRQQSGGETFPLERMRSCLPQRSTPRPTGADLPEGAPGLPRSGASDLPNAFFTPKTRVTIPAGLASGLSCHMRSCARPGCPWPWDEPLLGWGSGCWPGTKRLLYVALKSVTISFSNRRDTSKREIRKN